jgi:ABC-type cobalamin transport system ATPase subunit
VRTVFALGAPGGTSDERSRAALDRVETLAVDLVREKLGPRVQLVIIDEPALALEFDSEKQLERLLAHVAQERP